MAEEATRIWNEFCMTLAGISYPAQGYHTGDGITIPAWKIDEHMICSEFYDAAVVEKRKSHGKV